MTPTERIEQLLNGADEAMYVHQIATLAETTEDVAKESLRALAGRGLVEVIHTRGRWGNRYAAITSTKPVQPDRAPAPVAGSAVSEHCATAGAATPGTTPAFPPEAAGAAGSESLSTVADSGNEETRTFPDSISQQPAPIAQNRYVVAVPKRPLRVVKTRERAEALALAAVRRGAKGAEVFALTAVGRAKRDAVLVEQA